MAQELCLSYIGDTGKTIITLVERDTTARIALASPAFLPWLACEFRNVWVIDE